MGQVKLTLTKTQKSDNIGQVNCILINEERDPCFFVSNLARIWGNLRLWAYRLVGIDGPLKNVGLA